MAWGEGDSAKSDFISKGSLIKHLMRGGGGSKKTKNRLISYMDDPYVDRQGFNPFGLEIICMVP